jgi:hypothetical protein
MKQPILTSKTTSTTIHSDGTKLSTTVILETIPGDKEEKVETTTVVKEYTTENKLTADGELRIKVEEVTETTVTKKRIYFKDRPESVVGEIEVGWGGMLCGNKAVVEEEHDDDLTMDTALHLDTFGGKTVSSSNASRGSNNGVVKAESNEGRVKAPSALSMFTSPSTFFRKTHPSGNEGDAVETDKNTSVLAAGQETSTCIRDNKKKSINLDEEILNIVKKDGKDSHRSSASLIAIPPLSQQLQQSRAQEQSRQTVSSTCIDREVRQESETKDNFLTRSSPVPTQRPLSRGMATPSPTPKATVPKAAPPRPPSRQSPAPNMPSSMLTPTLTKSNRSSSKTRKKESMKPTVPKYKQSLLAADSDFASPKLTLSATTAAVTDDQFLHFFSYQPSTVNPLQPGKSLPSKWRKSTTVSIENTYCMNVSIHKNTAVVGVPYDRNNKGLLTGAAYIFEREENKDIWTQVKKIVPKEATEFATVGYAVGIHDDTIVVSVPNVGSTHPGGGSVHGEFDSISSSDIYIKFVSF